MWETRPTTAPPGGVSQLPSSADGAAPPGGLGAREAHAFRAACHFVASTPGGVLPGPPSPGPPWAPCAGGAPDGGVPPAPSRAVPVPDPPRAVGRSGRVTPLSAMQVRNAAIAVPSGPAESAAVGSAPVVALADALSPDALPVA